MKDGILHINSGQQYGTATQIPTEEAEDRGEEDRRAISTARS